MATVENRCNSIHDRKVRTVRDLPFFDYKTRLTVETRRVKCPDGGIKTEFISWLCPYSRVTNRLKSNIEGLCRILPIQHIAGNLHLHWGSVKTIDKRRLIRDVPVPDYSKMKRLMMDEFALHKDHRYATVVADAQTLQILWIGEGRSRESIRPFFEEMREHCPNAKVVYDLFHVIAKYGREVIDRVRVDRANELKEDKKARKLVKQGSWLLLRNRVNLKEGQDVKLSELLEANLPLSTVYVMKEALKNLWFCGSPKEVLRQWKSWYKRVEESGFEALKSFARKLKSYGRGILSSAKFQMGTSGLEGINNKIKVIKRMAYSFRDNEYFFLKIRDAFHGKP